MAVRAHSRVWRVRPEVAIAVGTEAGANLSKRVLDHSVQPVPIPARILAQLLATSDSRRRRERPPGLRLGLPTGRGESKPSAWTQTDRPDECAYFLSNAPLETALLTLARIASTRYTIEQCFEEGKGETGLDHYEISSWYRHITSMLAHAWLAWLRLRRNQQKGGLNPFSPVDRARSQTFARPLPSRSPELRLAWSVWRRGKRQQARQSHYRRHLNAFADLFYLQPP